jgi:outer membrane protein FlgP
MIFTLSQIRGQTLRSRLPVWLVLCLLLPGCTSSWLQSRKQSSADYFHPVEQQTDPVSPLIIRVTGYGAMSNEKNMSEAQRRLLAIRGSRIDAYRAMAERVYGTMVEGSTSVRDMVVESDRLRTWVDTSLQGARVVSSDVLPDGSVETVLEMVIDQGFRNCLQTRGNQRMNVDCRVPLGSGSGSSLSMAQPVQTDQGRRGTGLTETGAREAASDGNSLSAPAATAKSGSQSGFYFIE